MFEYPEDLAYSSRHLWTRTEKTRSEAVVGLTADLVDELGEIISIDLPMVDDELDMDRFCIHLHLATSIKHLRSPLSGRVIAINRDVLDNASLIHVAPYEQWLYRMEYDEEDELELLMNANQYIKYLDQF